MLDEEPFGWPARGAHRIGQFLGLGIYATEANGEHGAHVWMPSQREHQANGISVVVTAGEADDVDVRLAFSDGMGDVLGAFDGVDDEHEIANAFAAIGTKVA